MIKLMRVIVHWERAGLFPEPRRFPAALARTIIWALLLCPTGCTATRSQINRSLADGSGPEVRPASPLEAYQVACPDVLDLQMPERADLCGRRHVGPDGRIDLGNLGRLRVEGQSTGQIAQQVALVAGLSQGAVQVRVIEYNSQHVYLAGQGAGQRHVVDYRGPETVIDLLRRVGGISAGAAPDAVFVVRNHVGEDKRPEVFRINLRAILLQNDPRTNVAVQPLDQIYVGETRTCSFEKCIPPWLRPVYEAIVGIRSPTPSLSGINEPAEQEVRIGQ
jgi:polysaccharide biosynthesis/export protein